MDKKDWLTAELQRFRTSPAKKRDSLESRATAARYNHPMVVVVLDTGVEIHVPADLVQGLRGAKARALSDVRIEAGGSSLHWPQLDADLYVPGLIKGLLGSAHWMARIGHKGGATRSEAKARAARENGRKGGRPRKERKAA